MTYNTGNTKDVQKCTYAVTYIIGPILFAFRTPASYLFMFFSKSVQNPNLQYPTEFDAYSLQPRMCVGIVNTMYGLKQRTVNTAGSS